MVNLVQVFRVNTEKDFLPLIGQEQLEAAPIYRMLFAVDQPIFCHTLDHPRGVAFGAQQQVGQVHVIDARAIMNMHQCIEAGNR